MSFPYPNNTNIYPAGSRYSGYCALEPLNTMMAYRETAEGDLIVDSPDTPFDSCHRYPAIADAPLSLAVALAQQREDQNPATGGADSIDRWMDLDRWLEDNQPIKTQGWHEAARLAVDPSDDVCLSPETDNQSPITATSSEERNQPPHQERHPKLQCRWEGCTYSKTFSRTADVLRHVSAVHLTRGKYHCPMDTGCKSFNRRDNLMAHLQRRHNVTAKG